MSITIDPNDNSHDMGYLRLDDEELYANEFSYTIGGGNETESFTNTGKPGRYKGSKDEFSWDASGIAHEFHDLLIRYKLNKTTFPIKVFNRGPDGNVIHKGTLFYCRVDEVSVSQADDGNTLDVSGIALDFDLPQKT